MKTQKLKDESRKFAIGDIVYWYIKTKNGKERQFYKSLVTGHKEPFHDGGGDYAFSNNHRSYEMNIVYAVLKKGKKIVYTQKDPLNSRVPFERCPRRTVVNTQCFSSEAEMAIEIELFYGKILDDLKEAATTNPPSKPMGKAIASTMVEDLTDYSDLGEDVVILIDVEQGTRTLFDNLARLAKHIGKAEDGLLKAAVHTKWIDPRYRLWFPNKVHIPIPFVSLFRGTVYSDIIQLWEQGTKDRVTEWSPNKIYEAILGAIEQKTYQFEYQSHRYQLLNADGSLRQSEWIPDVNMNDSFSVKFAKIKDKALEVGRSPFVIAHTLQSHNYRLITDKEIEFIYQQTALNKDGLLLVD